LALKNHLLLNIIKVDKSLKKLFENTEIIFWDFDGVIKDSVKVKSEAFEELFSSYGQNFLKRVKKHHEVNGGLSRMEKIPIYLSWTNETVSNKNIQKYCNKFSKLVKQSVIDSEWIPGFLEFIAHHHSKKNVLVTATPFEEIKEILHKLDIERFFYQVYGAPVKKNAAISETLTFLKTGPEHAIMIGDSESDFLAAKENRVLFVLRKTDLNNSMHYLCKNYMFKDYLNE
jgi:HAD superfamily hydrolase (TIGR01549 family)